VQGLDLEHIGVMRRSISRPRKSRGEYAYTLIDTDGGLGMELLAKTRAIDGVLSARKL
jgi:hypothetical protein